MSKAAISYGDDSPLIRKEDRNPGRGRGCIAWLHCAAAVFLLLAGCHAGPPPLSPAAQQVRAAQSKLSVGITEQQVATAIGQPSVFRRGGGRREDVAIYQFPGARMTLYFYGGRLTRARSVRPPVNR